jgi:hypothetical protein
MDSLSRRTFTTTRSDTSLTVAVIATALHFTALHISSTQSARAFTHTHTHTHARARARARTHTHTHTHNRCAWPRRGGPRLTSPLTWCTHSRPEFTTGSSLPTRHSRAISAETVPSSTHSCPAASVRMARSLQPSSCAGSHHKPSPPTLHQPQ